MTHPFRGLPAALLALAFLPSLPATAAVLEVQALGSDGRALADAVVTLESPAARAALRPSVGVEVEQALRRFTRRVSVVTTGSALRFPNRDHVLHRVRVASPGTRDEFKLVAGAVSDPVVFDKPGIVTLGCAIHDSMQAWVVVVDTPWHGVSDASGRVRIAQVPPGGYRLRVWHPDLAPGAAAADQALQLPASGATQAVVRLPLAVSP